MTLCLPGELSDRHCGRCGRRWGNPRSPV